MNGSEQRYFGVYEFIDNFFNEIYYFQVKKGSEDVRDFFLKEFSGCQVSPSLTISAIRKSDAQS